MQAVDKSFNSTTTLAAPAGSPVKVGTEYYVRHIFDIISKSAFSRVISIRICDLEINNSPNSLARKRRCCDRIHLNAARGVRGRWPCFSRLRRRAPLLDRRCERREARHHCRRQDHCAARASTPVGQAATARAVCPRPPGGVHRGARRDVRCVLLQPSHVVHLARQCRSSAASLVCRKT